MSDSTDLVPAGGTALSDFPGRNLPGHNHLNVGAVAIEQERAIAEVQGQIIIAQRCPRSMALAMSDFLEACKSPEFAATAFYSVPNRGAGPSIRFAEEAARCYGNFQYGHRELSRSTGKSEIEVYAWDVQKNNRSTRQITVMHIRDKRGVVEGVPLTDQADIDNRIANVASKQMRGRILALLPKAMIAAGEAMAKKTLAGGTDRPLSAKVTDMVQAFQIRYGVNVAHLEAKIGHSLDNITIDEFADLRGVFNALNEGDKPSDHFPVPGAEPEQGADTTADRLAAKAKKPAVVKKEGTGEPVTEEKKADDKKTDPAAETKKADDAAKPNEAEKPTEQAKPQESGPPEVPPAEDESGPAASEQVQPPQEQAQQAQSDAPAPDAPAASDDGAQPTSDGTAPAARPALF